MMTITKAAVDWLEWPSAFVAVAVMLWVSSVSACAGVKLQVPSGWTTVVPRVSAPSWRVMVALTVPVPRISGVVSLVAPLGTISPASVPESLTSRVMATCGAAAVSFPEWPEPPEECSEVASTPSAPAPARIGQVMNPAL